VGQEGRAAQEEAIVFAVGRLGLVIQSASSRHRDAKVSYLPQPHSHCYSRVMRCASTSSHWRIFLVVHFDPNMSQAANPPVGSRTKSHHASARRSQQHVRTVAG